MEQTPVYPVEAILKMIASHVTRVILYENRGQHAQCVFRSGRSTVPADFGVKTAAAAAFGDIPRLLVPTLLTTLVTGERGVKDGESTLRKRLELRTI